MIAINLTEDPFSEETILLNESYADITMVPEVPESVTMRRAFYFNNVYNPELSSYIPTVKELTGEELRKLYNRIKREKQVWISKEVSMSVWRTIHDLNGNWDDDANMTKTKVKKLLETDEEFKAYYEEMKRVPVF